MKIAKKMKHTGSLVRELLDVRVNANGRMGAEGPGQHDDLVMAMAIGLAVRAELLEKGLSAGKGALFTGVSGPIER